MKKSDGGKKVPVQKMKPQPISKEDTKIPKLNKSFVVETYKEDPSIARNKAKLKMISKVKMPSKPKK